MVREGLDPLLRGLRAADPKLSCGSVEANFNDELSMTIDEESVVIVGAGHAGAHAAIALRNGGFGGSVAMISEETEFPYERPPLSKEYLLGERSFERLLLRPPEFWQERRIRMLLGRRATSVDARARAVTLDSGETIGYRHLIWAAGAAPRTLDCEGNGLAGVHVLRTRDHADRLRRELDSASRAVIIGGGYIGLEAAAALRTLGKQVVVLESLDRLLARVTGTELSRFMDRCEDRFPHRRVRSRVWRAPQ
jgi:3-phenylpropionate/trans-cinnamate dioxygenase ferredoxin reductase subunit